MRIRFFVILLAICQSAVLSAQTDDVYGNVLRQLEKNSPLFKLIDQQCQAGQAEAFAGSLFSDPSVEIGHFWGSPDEKGTRWNLSVRQSFEMPTAYIHKNRLRHLQSQLATDISNEAIRALRLEIKQLCADIVYYNALVYIFEGRAQIADELSAVYTQRLASGDCNMLQFNRVQMDVADAKNNLERAVTERNMLLTTLQELNGGTFIPVQEMYFPERLIDSDYEAYIKQLGNKDIPNGSLQKLHTQAVIDSARVAVARNEWLPELSVGYSSEVLAHEAFRGMVVGVSLPLWSNARKVRASKLHANTAQLDYEVALQRNDIQSRALFAKIHSLNNRVANLQSAFEHYNSVALLTKAFQAGELDLEDFLLELDFYNNAAIAILEAQYEMESAVLQLEAIAL